MDTLQEILEIDFSYVFISFFTVLIGTKSIITIFEWIINKFGLETKWMRKKRKEHELLLKTSQSLAALQEKHIEDAIQSDEHDKLLEDEMSTLMDEIEGLTASIKSVSENEEERGKQIEALMCGSKELLGAEIDKRYREYVSLDGIPESEVDEFDDIFTAYKGLKGNHGRDTKYNYVKNHLPVIPVETKLIINKVRNEL